MSDYKERRCKACGKLLIDEKLFCSRCQLEGRNKVRDVSGIVGGLAVAAFSAAALSNDNKNDTEA